MENYGKIIGAGLAGSEAAWYLANHGIKVKLCKGRPVKMTPAHHTENLQNWLFQFFRSMMHIMLLDY